MSAAIEELLSLRPMTLEDLDAVLDIEQRAHVSPWSHELMRRELDHAWATILLCEAPSPGGPRIVGYIVYWLVHDEVHVLNVATDPDFRRRGVGALLLVAAERTGASRGALVSTLEVRRSNEAAIGLYRKLGYRQVGVRPRYYRENDEDALVMVKDLDTP